MIHVISGYFRSGTSAMMQALIAGGMSAAWSETRNEVATAHADEHYSPNPNGLYEVPLKEYGGVRFPLQYHGKLIKVMLWGLDHLAVNPEGYRVVIMRRDPEEIRQSYEAFFGKKCPSLDEYAERIERAKSMLLNRGDVEGVTIMGYREVIDSPAEHFIHLRRCGWPIDPLEAAATIDPAQYRFRRELLTVGI